ncbi:hypothetical protein [Deinococcus ruber]|uniref:Uncharacterized protein n=1 Tax=Deinococcus ruber TaxID=1848197 RepID=A0A918FEX6_9DEIO|nr:hypothetical protein [Deinococcus ruber]GGR32670.1 hypothetical protein GCM10008957_48910 [Deinococcus ruber]
MKHFFRSMIAVLATTLLPTAAHAQSTLTPLAQATTQVQSVSAIVTAPGAQPMVMPLNVYTLPYGTVTIAEGVYFIPNYENTGISIYIQSPKALHVATLEEMVRYQAEWQRLTQAVTQAPAPTPSAPVAVSLPKPVAPAPMPAARATPMPITAPVTTVATVPAPVAPQMAAPVLQAAAPAAPALPAPMPSASQVFATPVPLPAAAQVFASPAAPTAPAPMAALPTPAQVFAPAAAPVAAAPLAATPAPLPTAWAPEVTLVPNYLRLSFRGRGTTVSYSISNVSDISSVQIDPASLRAYQNGQQIAAQLTARDSSAGTATGTLMPKSMLVGTVKVQTRATDPVTLTWQAKDASGRSYPISYAWLPQ